MGQTDNLHSERPLLEIPNALTRSNKVDPQRTRESAVWLLDHMREHLGLDDYSDTEILDYGCGVKFSEALINLRMPIKRYVGVDVHKGLVDYLTEHVHDPRFEYHHIDMRNEMYNPEGTPLSEATTLPLGDQQFDLICLFSVFTHLAPHDYSALLRLLRQYAKPDGHLFYTLYINELTEGGHGLMDSWGKFLDADDPLIAERLRDAPSVADQRELQKMLAPDFLDLYPASPLRWAVYSEKHARELLENTGWEVVTLAPPDEHIQHHFVCRPA
jgi:SAM-dependent methyltransferase